VSTHLVSISIGPVQDFIAQARRSRDLWFGSHLLSEIARAAAKAVAAIGGELIFPAVEKDDVELQPCDGMTRSNATSAPPLAISNKLLFQANDEAMAEACVVAARNGAQVRWQAMAENARQNADRLLEWPQVKPIWEEQVEGILEFYAAAAPVTTETFGTVRDLLERQLAARKNLREFQQFQHHRAGAPKSSFDGSRVSVLRSSKESESARRQYRIPNAENLDAIGVVKRTGGRPEQFVPIANVALAPWLHAVRQKPMLDDLVGKLETSMLSGSYQDVFGRVTRSDTPSGKVFRTDAQVLLDGRLEALLVESCGFRNIKELEADPTYRNLKSQLQIIREAGNAPHPYVATVVADGDRMGAALRLLTSGEQLRRFSIKLSEFAQEARRIVEQQNWGSLLYAGGDDVVAFLPLANAIACARNLHDVFTDLMSPGNALPGNWLANDPRRPLPTLSVGIGVGHILTGMGTLLDFGRSAEKVAKGDSLAAELQRNALAVVVDKRSGGRTDWRCQWSDDGKASPTEIFESAVARVGRGEESSVLPATKLAEIRRDLSRFPTEVDAASSKVWAGILQKDVLRTLRRATKVTSSQKFDDISLSNNSLDIERFGLELPMDDYSDARERIGNWVALHMIAKEIHRGSVWPLQDGSEVTN